MKRGQKVQIRGLVSYRGTMLNSIRQEFYTRTVGTVEVGPDEVGWCLVSFPGLDKPMDVPLELLTTNLSFKKK